MKEKEECTGAVRERERDSTSALAGRDPVLTFGPFAGCHACTCVPMS